MKREQIIETLVLMRESLVRDETPTAARQHRAITQLLAGCGYEEPDYREPVHVTLINDKDTWMVENPEKLKDYTRTNPALTLRRAGKEFMEVDPEGFKQACLDYPQQAASRCSKEWSEIDPTEYLKYVQKTKRRRLGRDDIKTEIAALDPQLFVEMLRMYIIGDYHGAKDAQLSKEVIDLWVEIDPGSFIGECDRSGTLALVNAPGQLLAVDPMVLSAQWARDYPMGILNSPEVFSDLNEKEFLRQARRLLDSVPAHKLDNTSPLHAFLLENYWEEFYPKYSPNTILEAAPEKYALKNPEKFQEACTSFRPLAMRDGTWQLLLELNPSSFLKIVERLTEGWAPADLSYLDPTTEKLDAWYGLDAESWETHGNTAIQIMLSKNHRTLTMYATYTAQNTQILLDTLSYYQARHVELSDTLMGPEKPIDETWLALGDLLFDDEDTRKLVEHTLQTPGQDLEAISWATVRAGNLNTVRPRITKPRKETPGVTR